MKIIIDSGATKAEWCIVDYEGEDYRFTTEGMNATVMSQEDIAGIISRAAARIDGTEKVRNVYFYGAGIVLPEDGSIPENIKVMDSFFRMAFPKADVEFASDILSAARAVCGHEKGIVAILGTGSNSCLYNGKTIVDHINAGGFILGDEGSGARLGRMFLSDLIKGLVPQDIAKEFAIGHDSSYIGIVNSVYKSQSPSRYLGSLAPWILDRYEKSEYIRTLTDTNFNDFIDRCLLRYEPAPVGVIGSFGFENRDILTRLGKTKGLTFKRFLKDPISGLIEYHK